MKRERFCGKSASVVGLLITVMIVFLAGCPKNPPLQQEPLQVSFVPQGVIPEISNVQIPVNAKVIFSWSAGGKIYSETSRNTGSDIIANPGAARPMLVTTPGGQAALYRVKTGTDSNFGMPKNIKVPVGSRLEVVACFATQPDGRGPSFRLGADWRVCDNCQSTSFKGSTHLDIFGSSVRSQDGGWRVTKLSESRDFYSGKNQAWFDLYNDGPTNIAPNNHNWVVGWGQFLGQQYPGANDIWEGGDAYLAWMIVWYEPAN